LDKDTAILKLIDETDLACNELKKQKKKAKEDLIKAFDKMKAELDRQQAKLLEELDQTFIEKDRKLKIELSELQYQHQGIKSALLFTDKLLEMGHDLELTLNHDPIFANFNRVLENNRLHTFQESIIDFSCLKFVASNQSTTCVAIQRFGFIEKSANNASPFQSCIENGKKHMNIPCILNKPRSFQIILKDADGNLVDYPAKRTLKINIKGPSISIRILLFLPFLIKPFFSSSFFFRFFFVFNFID